MSLSSPSRVALLAAALLSGCAEPTATDLARSPLLARAPAGGEIPAAVQWNEVARSLVARNRSTVFVAFRTYTLVSVAQQEALRAAKEGSESDHVSGRAAIAAASAAVLKSVYGGNSFSIDSILQLQLANADWLEGEGVDAAAGAEIGRAAGLAVVEHAKTDGYSDAWSGTIPTGAGKWYSITSPPSLPAGVSLVDARTWFLTSQDQFRPDSHPAFGSAAFAAALAEVRHISDTRTRAQDSIAKYWAMGAGTHTPAGHWNAEASALAVRHRLNEQRAVRLLALMNMAMYDAIIASNDAKYEYWLLRPSQADPAITLSITPLPNFPAYPSNHATISSAAAEILATTFPAEAARLRADAEQAALSRVYGGIHYRFDGDAGLELGRQVAQWAIAVSGNAHRPFAAAAGN